MSQSSTSTALNSSTYAELVDLGRRLYEHSLVRRESEFITDPRGHPIGWLLDTRIPMLNGNMFREVGEVLGLTPAYVRGVVSFYTMYYQHPMGRHVVQVCTTSPCHLCGSADVLKAILQETGCGELGATSADGRFTVIEVECLGACGFATPVMVGDDFHDGVTLERVPELLKGYA